MSTPGAWLDLLGATIWGLPGAVLWALAFALACSLAWCAQGGWCDDFTLADETQTRRKWGFWLSALALLYLTGPLGLAREHFIYEAVRLGGACLLIYSAYSTGANYQEIYGRGKHRDTTPGEAFFNGFIGCAVLAMICASTLGEHTEDGDPLRGGGEVVQDFIPTDKERQESGARAFTWMFIPYAFGVQVGAAKAAVVAARRQEVEQAEIDAHSAQDAA